MVLLVVLTVLSWHGGLASCRVATAQAYRIIDEPLKYNGALLGVKAELLLFRKQERAVVTLRGIPLGGKISGIARFDKDGFKVDLDPDLERQLHRRRVKIQGAGAFHDYSKVWVLIQLPFGLGRHTMSLARTY